MGFYGFPPCPSDVLTDGFSAHTASLFAVSYDLRCPLESLELPKPAPNLCLNPYFLYNYEKRTVNATEIHGANDPNIGGEVKWALNSHAVLDLTFNTDFAYADVDKPVNNFIRFNVFFPERRQPQHHLNRRRLYAFR